MLPKVILGPSADVIARLLFDQCPSGTKIARTITPLSVDIRRKLQDPSVIRNSQVRTQIVRAEGREIWLKVGDGVWLSGQAIPSAYFQLDHVLDLRCDEHDALFCIMRTSSDDALSSQDPLLAVDVTALCKTSQQVVRMLTQETMEALTVRLNGGIAQKTMTNAAS